jgi:hypothetical protein
MPQNVDVVIIRSYLKEDVFWAIPLIEYFFDEIWPFTQLKANWSFVCLAACVTLNLEAHPHILAHN